MSHSSPQLVPQPQPQVPAEGSCWESFTQCFSNCWSSVSEINVGDWLPNINREGEWNCTEICFAVTITVAAVAGLALSFFKALSFGVILFGVVTVLSAVRLITYLSGCAPTPEPQGEADHARHSPQSHALEGQTGDVRDYTGTDVRMLRDFHVNRSQHVAPKFLTDEARDVHDFILRMQQHPQRDKAQEAKRDTHTETGDTASSPDSPPLSVAPTKAISSSSSHENLQLPPAAHSEPGLGSTSMGASPIQMPPSTPAQELSSSWQFENDVGQSQILDGNQSPGMVPPKAGQFAAATQANKSSSATASASSASLTTKPGQFAAATQANKSSSATASASSASLTINTAAAVTSSASGAKLSTAAVIATMAAAAASSAKQAQ